MSHNLNSLKGVLERIIYGSVIGLIYADASSLDYSSCNEGVDGWGGYSGKGSQV